MPVTAGPTSRFWTPLDGTSTTRLFAWYDASDTSTIDISTGAATWRDKGNRTKRNVSQATTTKQPLTGTKSRNGRQVLVFDSTDDLITTGAGTFTLSQPYAFFLAFKFNSIGHRRDVFNGNNVGYIINVIGGDNFEYYCGGVISSGLLADTNSHIHSVACTGTLSTFTYRIDASLARLGTGGAGSASQAITEIDFGTGDLAGPGDMDLYEFILVEGIPTQADYLIYERYLSYRWAIPLSGYSAGTGTAGGVASAPLVNVRHNPFYMDFIAPNADPTVTRRWDQAHPTQVYNM